MFTEPVSFLDIVLEETGSFCYRLFALRYSFGDEPNLAANSL